MAATLLADGLPHRQTRQSSLSLDWRIELWRQAGRSQNGSACRRFVEGTCLIAPLSTTGMDNTGGCLRAMSGNLDPLAVDRQFFTSLVEADFQALDRLLARDFMLIDVMSGSEITKSSLLAALGSGQVKFARIAPAANLL